MSAPPPPTEAVLHEGRILPVHAQEGHGPDAALDGTDEERRKVTRLVRFVAMFVAWPSLSIAFAFLVFTDPSDHWLHIGGLMPLGIAALVVFAQAPRLARRWMAAEARR